MKTKMAFVRQRFVVGSESLDKNMFSFNLLTLYFTKRSNFLLAVLGQGDSTCCIAAFFSVVPRVISRVTVFYMCNRVEDGDSV
jgi:hypothetical protein